MKKKKQKNLAAQRFLNIENIDNGLIFTADRYVIGFLSVHGPDQKLLDITGREAAMRQLTTVLEQERTPCQVISVPRTVDVVEMVARLESLKAAADPESQQPLVQLLKGEIDAMNQLMADGAKEPFVLLKVWEKAAAGADLRLVRRLQNLALRLADCRVTSHVLDSQEVKWLCCLYTNLDQFISQSEQSTDIPIISGQPRTMTNRINENQTAILLNDIAPPGGFVFRHNSLFIGPVSARCYGAVKYPSEVPYGWLVPLMGSLDCITCITFYPGSSVELGDALSKSIQQSAVRASEVKDARSQKEYLRRIEGADKMLDALDARNMTVGHISIVVMPFASSEEELTKVCEKALTLCAGAHLKMKCLANLQADAFRHISPFYTNQVRIDNMLKQIIPLNTLCGGEPMTVTLLRDDGGIYFGQTTDGSPICINLFYRGRDRTNSNLVTLGTSGSGKSTAMKHLLESMYMMGVKILIIDPEREYRDLCRNLGGAWLDVGGGFAKINPLDVRAAPEDAPEEEDKLYTGCANSMSMHIKTLLVRLRLQYPELTDIQCSLLESSLLQLYNNFGMDFDTDITHLEPESFPQMSDWYNLLIKLSETDPKYTDLAILMRSMAIGADAFLWNGHTNIDSDNQIVCFDTNKLLNFSQATQASCYFNILSLCWDIISRNRDERIILYMDEGHIALDPRLPEVGLYLRNLAKRIRKYEGGLWFVSQSSADMLHESIRMSGQAIVDNAAYRLLFRCEAKNLEDTVDLFRLTPAESKLLAVLERKNALCLVGNTHHIRTVFNLPQYKLDLMGRGGGQ